MLTFFILIVLTAEIILTCQIVSLILKADRKVCDLNEQISALTPKIESGFTDVRISLNKILLGLNKFEQKLQSKKEAYKYAILKNIITIILFFVLRVNGRKILSTMDLAFSIHTLIIQWLKKLI